MLCQAQQLLVQFKELLHCENGVLQTFAHTLCTSSDLGNLISRLLYTITLNCIVQGAANKWTCSKTTFDTKCLGPQIDRPPLLHPAQSKTAQCSRETEDFCGKHSLERSPQKRLRRLRKHSPGVNDVTALCRSAMAQHTPHHLTQTLASLSPSLVRPLMWKIQLKTHCIPSNLPWIKSQIKWIQLIQTK